MEIQHWIHEHPLILIEELNDNDDRHYRCLGCAQPIGAGPCYHCNKCSRFLHKSCLELPKKINHPIHHQHSLTLHAMPPNPYLICRCDACAISWHCFTYHCSDCNFDVCVNCTSLPYKIEYGGHEHPLALWPKPASFSCDACGSNHSEGVSYLCCKCMLWVHRDCASLPSSKKIAGHDHPLSLTYSLNTEYSGYKTYCKLCEEEVPKKCWIYNCAGCKFSIHLKCSVASGGRPKLLREDKYIQFEENHLLINTVSLPILDPNIDVISHIFKDITLGQKEIAMELKHFSHDHQLTLFDKLITIEICNACARPISAPFYGCSQCGFFLHKWCSELPNEVQQPFHRDHPLTLLAMAAKPYGLFECSVCRNFSNGFTFHCAPCNVYLDVKCGSYPAIIEHEGHKHPLKLWVNVHERCSACNQFFIGFMYECVRCHFKIDIQCAFFPSKVWHRFDKDHPFVLTYSLIDDPSEEFYCEFCEGEIFSNFWFYHCIHCNWSAHTRCLCKVDDDYSNIKFGSTLDLKAHPHTLTLGKKAVDEALCDRCGDSCNVFAYECKECHYNLHSDCASTCSNECQVREHS